MTLQDCYIALGGNYADVSARLTSDRIIQKFILKFLDDKSYDQLCAAMKEENYEEAFLAAHTIKGICQNLSFTRLLESSSRLTEALRHGWTPEADGLLRQVEEDYFTLITAIRTFQAESAG